MTVPGYEGLRVYYGDLHSHCDVGYGHGTPEDAYTNARLQLDFASVTAHAVWPDMPAPDERLGATVAYHRQGFAQAAARWPHLREVTDAANDDGRFVTFLSYEWHSLRYGDHNVYYRDGRGEIIQAADLDELRAALRHLAASGTEALLIPHHIGYRAGYRGIDWRMFTPEFSPVVEIVSMHGVAESDDAPYPYLHTMGPRDGRSTVRHGLRLGKVFGVIGSTDHHAAHPGSHGWGRAGVWARGLTREAIWDALVQRRTYALTGDRIALALSLNGHPMGAVVDPAPVRLLHVAVEAGDAIDYVDVVYNGGVVHRWMPPAAECAGGACAVTLELGWGDRTDAVEWRVDLGVEGGRLLDVEPRLRGDDAISPRQGGSGGVALSAWERLGDRVVLRTTTRGNPGPLTPGTQAICLRLEGDACARLTGRINDHVIDVPLSALWQASRVGYLGGFRAPAYRFSRAVSDRESSGAFVFEHRSDGQGDWYYVRVRQTNHQWAWSSPIWVGTPRA
ncbi:MAG: DUF3604 domain-containing protein [Armatimonadota bacterium]|nr:DUF3604 domain-containing protein [Armatimonadota bacterium]MDR7454674.1 DUF3604 domain-containing protein [Armatimonadota bacterium]MDR7456595.1 DUF3604 domain-containing protein [Armatimonadota bacterium]MDR7497714.1 DUF3604 domain-containing protein [Armatimonadota bacterium]MDR7510695.1 DUF3604 domain-containing protein [Armatimonadota bacterium]